MRIAILSRGAQLYSTRRLIETGTERGHDMRVINPLHCYMNITSNNPEVHYRGQILEGIDAVIPRIGASISYFGTALLNQFEMMNVYTVNNALAISRARDKLTSLQLLARKGIGLPVTGFAHSPDNTEDLVDIVGRPPLVIKLLDSTHGNGVVLAESQQAGENAIEHFRSLGANFLVQEFIQEARGTDIRCFVIGGKVIAAMRRQAKAGEFRSNLHLGGTAVTVDLSDEETALAVRSAGIIGLNIAGIDILRSKRGALVIEVNASPGLQGVETATGKDIASDIIHFIERNARRGKRRQPN